MTVTINKGYQADGTPASLTTTVHHFPTTFAKREASAGESILVNIGTPTDRLEVVKTAIKDVKNIYNGTGIIPGYQSPNQTGRQLLVQLNETWSKVDSEDVAYRQDLPVQAHLVIKIPNDSLISENDVLELIGRLNGLLSESDGGVEPTITSRLVALLRGALTPAGL